MGWSLQRGRLDSSSSVAPSMGQPQALKKAHREGLGVEVHLSLVVFGDVGHVVVGGEHSLKGSPAKRLLQLRGDDIGRGLGMRTGRSWLRIRIRIRNSFIALVFANKECAFVELVHNVEH